MSDSNVPGPEPVLPPIIAANLSSLAKLGLAAGAGWLVHHGLIASTDTSEVIDLGTGVVLALGAFGWAWLKNKLTAKKLVAAAATGVPTADPKAPEVQAAIVAAIADPKSAIAAKETP